MHRIALIWLAALTPLTAQAQTAPAAPAADMVAVPVLDRAVAKGDLLSAGDFVEQEIPRAQLRAAPPLRDIVGMEASRSLAAGAIVRTSDVIRPQLVRRGEPITILLRNGGLSITTAGRALSNGAAGDFVRIVSLSTNRTLDGVVDGTGTVRVSPN
ncbi:flagellar basal body P-ring formation chaperone FlgA [Sphingomonas sp. 37zxx]|uniref:flagellar basal body P-ring formation chaperone FlgA n=1 Tax=Sphingomonas sp. 37zxx TaxID=1550073 RepID=UPI00053BEA47|nr:flagellar basal body P-ring formation chaperone FlgA [Sphingomonas sp. 37zxx]